MQYNRLTTTPYTQTGNWWSTMKLPKNRLKSFTKSIPVGHGSGGIGFRDGCIEITDPVLTAHLYSCMFIFSLLIGFQPGINSVSICFTTYQWRYGFSVCWIHSMVVIEQYWFVVQPVSYTIRYVEWLYYFLFLIPSLTLILGVQVVLPEMGDYITATHDPRHGRHQL